MVRTNLKPIDGICDAFYDNIIIYIIYYNIYYDHIAKIGLVVL